jgi:hypothetical protein
MSTGIIKIVVLPFFCLFMYAWITFANRPSNSLFYYINCIASVFVLIIFLAVYLLNPWYDFFANDSTVICVHRLDS